MFLISKTCAAIAVAARNGTLQIVERTARLGGTFIAICDEHGIIEVADSMTAAMARVAGVAHGAR